LNFLSLPVSLTLICCGVRFIHRNKVDVPMYIPPKPTKETKPAKAKKSKKKKGDKGDGAVDGEEVSPESVHADEGASS